jgi:glyoxylase-like metal-dependent hydrolase (beta-lactamase superfamily II)
MKIFYRRILQLIGAVIGVIVLLFASYMLIMSLSVRKMTPVETSQINDDVYAVKDKYVNMYLLRDGDYYIAIDAGINKVSVSDELEKLGIDPDIVRAVILTHSDSDHTGALSLFKNATVYMYKDEEQMINGETGRFLFFGNRIDTGEYTLLDDGLFTSGSLSILPVPTPGHTAGSTCYLVNDCYLFTGDALRLNNGYVEPFPGLINKNARRARRSMSRIRDMKNVQYIFTAHYGFTDDFAKAISSR